MQLLDPFVHDAWKKKTFARMSNSAYFPWDNTTYCGYGEPEQCEERSIILSMPQARALGHSLSLSPLKPTIRLRVNCQEEWHLNKGTRDQPTW